jgi:uncharacterized protein
MRTGVANWLWLAGAPVRLALIALIRGYRLTLGQLLGGNCRFHPSCSTYAEQAIRELGWVRGVVLSAWRILRCTPLSKGGVDYPPMPQGAGHRQVYDAVILEDDRRSAGGVVEGSQLAGLATVPGEARA